MGLPQLFPILGHLQIGVFFFRISSNLDFRVSGWNPQINARVVPGSTSYKSLLTSTDIWNDNPAW